MKNIHRIFGGFFIVWIHISILVIPQETIYAQKRSAMMLTTRKDTVQFAQRSLEGYVKNFLTEKNCSKFGFKSLQEAQSARVGEPYQIKLIGLKELKSYEPRTEAKSGVIHTKDLWFPVQVNNEIRTKLELVDKNGRLVPGEFGTINSVETIVTVRNQIPGLLESRQIRSDCKISLLKIPVLNANFFLVSSSAGDFLIPAMMQPQRFNIENAKIYKAEEILAILTKYVQQIDENKVM